MKIFTIRIADDIWKSCRDSIGELGYVMSDNQLVTVMLVRGVRQTLIDNRPKTGISSPRRKGG